MMIVPFTKTLGPITGPTSDRATIVEALSAVRPVGGTAIFDGIVETCKLIENTDGRRAIVLVTDGYDEHSSGSLNDALTAAKTARVVVYVVGIGGVAGISLKGERLLRRLAEETGGRAFFPSREDQLPAAHAALIEDIENRYLIGYAPSNQVADGAWRAISLTTADPNHVVRTREGYFAPSPPPVQPTLEFTATDSGGRFIDLTADDVMIDEDGVPQKIETFQDAVAPVSIYLVLDASGSMRKSAEQVMEAAREFVRSLRPQDSLAVLLFADHQTLVQDLTKNRRLAFNAIDSYVADGGTALYDALTDAMVGLRGTDGRRAVVVLTDGRDENNPGTAPGSLRTLEETLEATRQVGATVFAVAIGNNVDRGALEQLATISGGQIYSPATATELTAKYKEVVENLRRRYVSRAPRFLWTVFCEKENELCPRENSTRLRPLRSPSGLPPRPQPRRRSSARGGGRRDGRCR